MVLGQDWSGIARGRERGGPWEVERGCCRSLVPSTKRSWGSGLLGSHSLWLGKPSGVVAGCGCGEIRGRCAAQPQSSHSPFQELKGGKNPSAAPAPIKPPLTKHQKAWPDHGQGQGWELWGNSQNKPPRGLRSDQLQPLPPPPPKWRSGGAPIRAGSASRSIISPGAQNRNFFCKWSHGKNISHFSHHRQWKA